MSKVLWIGAGFGALGLVGVGVALYSVGSGFWDGFADGFRKGFSEGYSGQLTDEEIRAEVAAFNAQTPHRVDEVTIVDHLAIDGRTVTYHYLVDAVALPLDMPVLEAEAIAQNCAHPWSRAILRKDWVLAHTYRASDDEALGEFAVTNDACPD